MQSFFLGHPFSQLKPKNIEETVTAQSDLGNFIKKYLEVEIENIECTKIMSKIARSYSDKHGLKDLIKEFIGIDISKQHQNSDFGGDLSQAQIKYCANDVVYLHKIHDELNKILNYEVTTARLTKITVSPAKNSIRYRS